MDFCKSFVVAKVEEGPSGLATCWGLATSTAVDSDGEVASYPETARSYRAWSKSCLDTTTAAGQEPSRGNIRLMHGPKIAGKATRIDYLDDKQEIWLGVEAADQEMSDYMRRGLVSFFSHAGKYGRRWCPTCNTDIPSGLHCPTCRADVAVHYYPDPVTEISLVDRGANPEATFQYVKANGASELRKFLKEGIDMSQKRKAGLSPRELVESTVHIHKDMASHCQKMAASERELGECAKSRADFASASLHKSRGDIFDEMATAHSQHVEQLGAARSSMPDMWALAGETVDANGQTISGKAAGDDSENFFERVFGSWPSAPIAKVTPMSDLFK